jgi:rhodanese-related sulfurtransferase
MEPYAEITPEELSARLRGPVAPWLLDVRDAWEHELAALPGARLIPLGELEWRVDEISAAAGPEPGREIVVYCHHGLRSAAAVEWLRAQGLPAVNLRGGIDAWAARVDRSLPRY